MIFLHLFAIDLSSRVSPAKAQTSILAARGQESVQPRLLLAHQRRKDTPLPLRRRDGENRAGSLNTVRALNHGSRPRSRPSAFIFARLVASCTEITPPPLCPTVPSPRARTPTECPISKGCSYSAPGAPFLLVPFR